MVKWIVGVVVVGWTAVLLACLYGADAYCADLVAKGTVVVGAFIYALMFMGG